MHGSVARRLMGAALLLGAACGGADRGPAWPKSAGAVAVDEWQEDGGEPISPRGAAPAIEEGGAARSEPAGEKDASSKTGFPELDAILESARTGPGEPLPQEVLDLLDTLDGPTSIVIEVED